MADPQRNWQSSSHGRALFAVRIIGAGEVIRRESPIPWKKTAAFMAIGMALFILVYTKTIGVFGWESALVGLVVGYWSRTLKQTALNTFLCLLGSPLGFPAMVVYGIASTDGVIAPERIWSTMITVGPAVALSVLALYATWIAAVPAGVFLRFVRELFAR